MNTMRKILFPTDFSPAANHAFRYALHLAGKLGAKLITYHIYQEPVTTDITYMPFSMQRFFETVQLTAFENHRDAIPPLREMAEEEGLGQVEMNHVLLEGRDVSRGILQAIRREAPDLVVMGTKGASALKEIFVGSVSAEVLENASCPVVVVPKDAATQNTPRRMAFTTDFREEEIPALRYALEIAAFFDATVHVINVDITHTHIYHKRMEELKKKFTDAQKVKFHILDGDDLIKTISDYLEDYSIDMLVMLSYKRNLLEELFHYSLAKKMAYHGHTPILALPADMFDE